jgi:cytochrome c-type biogenesis protein CcmE
MAYRSDLDALREREAALSRELLELGDLEERRDRLRKDLASVRAAMASSRPGGALRMLRAPAIALPCDVPWDSMEGDARVRFCGQCKKSVYNLSAMTRREAADLLDREAAPCIRYYQRPDGTVLTTDCAIGRRKRVRRRFPGVAAAGVLAAGLLVAAFEGATGGQIPVHTVDNLPSKLARSGLMRVEGTLVHGSMGTWERGITFELESRGRRLPVRHTQSLLPDNFRDIPAVPLQVIVEGELLEDGMFLSTAALAKSPSGSMYAPPHGAPSSTPP